MVSNFPTKELKVMDSKWLADACEFRKLKGLGWCLVCKAPEMQRISDGVKVIDLYKEVLNSEGVEVC